MIIECKACANGVSKKATTCPHCGHPLRVSLLNFVLACAIILFVAELVL